VAGDLPAAVHSGCNQHTSSNCTVAVPRCTVLMLSADLERKKQRSEAESDTEQQQQHAGKEHLQPPQPSFAPQVSTRLDAAILHSLGSARQLRVPAACPAPHTRYQRARLSCCCISTGAVPLAGEHACPNQRR
jgi:hypothetical protein